MCYKYEETNLIRTRNIIMKTENILISEIIVDSRFQFRAELDNEVVRNYTELILEGVEFPPVDVFRTPEGLILVDGFQRLESAKISDKRKINANVHEGTERDALLYALAANKTHGARLSNADKRKKGMFVLNDSELSLLSDNKLAELTGITQQSLSNWRRELKAEKLAKGEEVSTIRKVVTKAGRSYNIETKNQGRPKKTESKLPALPVEEEDEPTEKLLDFFLASDQELQTEQYQNLKLGSRFTAGKHILYFQDVVKLKKELDTLYTLMIYVGDIDKLIKNQAWLMDTSDSVIVVCTSGSSVPKLQEVEYISNSGTLVSIREKPYYLAHYSAEKTTMPDLAVNSANLYMSEMLDAFTKPGDTVLLIEPEYVLLATIEQSGRIATIVSSQQSIMQKDLIEWTNRWGTDQPIEKLK